VAQIFPEWTNKLQTYAAVVAVVLFLAVIGFFWYYGSPKYTDVGYRPVQPVPYSHKLHAGDLGLDCRYCHNTVEYSAVANVPPTQTCMNCHKLILTESEKLLLVRESWATKCHGNVRRMEEVTQMEPLSMGWCLDCHRNPGPNLRPHEELTNMEWTPPPDQAAFAERVIREKKIEPPVDCSGCHR